LNTATGTFTAVNNGAASLTATGIDNAGDVVGFFVNGAGKDRGFVDIGGHFTTVSLPGFADTELFGINNKGLAVGEAFGPAGFTVGIVYNIGLKTFTRVSDPHGIGATVVNGINDAGDLVGFYTNATTGYTIGMLATPGPVAKTGGATAQSFDAYSLLASDAGIHSSLHHETPHVNGALNLAAGPHQW
jgi:hypothetical protein